MHAHNSEEVTTFEAWIIWQLLKDNNFTGTSAAYISEIVGVQAKLFRVTAPRAYERSTMKSQQRF